MPDIFYYLLQGRYLIHIEKSYLYNSGYTNKEF